MRSPVMSQWMRGACVAATLGMLGAGAGCLSSSSDAQRKMAEQKRTWLLEADVSAVETRPPKFAEMKIRAFRALPPFNAAGIVVKRANGEAAVDFYNAWVAPPHDLIRVQAMRYLEQTGLFSAVYDTASGTQTPLGLEGTMCELFLDCRDENRPVAAVTLRLVLLDESSPVFTVLGSAEATARAAYNPGAADGIARAFNTALTQALAALAQNLAGL